jgi:putative oxidoreductase
MNLKLIGRLLIAYLFLASATYEIIYEPGEYVDLIKDKGLAFPLILAILALTVKILGGLSLALNIHPKFGAIILIVFMLIVTPIYHNGFNDVTEMSSMLKNIAIIGGLLFILDGGD